MMRYNPRDWYWLASDGRLYTSARQGIVTAADADYQAWLAAGGVATAWPSDDSGAQTTQSLQDVLTPYGLFADLTAYANVRQWQKAIGGYTATVGGQQIAFSTTSESLGLITGKAARFQQPGAPASVQWQTGPSTFVTIAAADFVVLATAIADYVQSTFDKLAVVTAGIEGGAITSQAQVDAGLA